MNEAEPIALERARQHLEPARQEQALAMVDLGDERHFLGWHPVLGYFVIRQRAESAPAALPAYMAMLEQATHVHAGGASPKEAMDNLIALFNQVAERLEAQEEG